jgi:hypothetical protein
MNIMRRERFIPLIQVVPVAPIEDGILQEDDGLFLLEDDSGHLVLET